MKRITGNRLLCLVLCVLVLAGTAVYLMIDHKTFGEAVRYGLQFGTVETNIGEITDAVQVEQTLPVDKTLTKVGIWFDTYDRKNHGNVFVTVTGCQSGRVYGEYTLKANRIAIAEDTVFTLEEPVSPRQDDRICLTVTSDCLCGSALSIRSVEKPEGEDTQLTVNGEKDETTSLCCVTVGKGENAGKLFTVKAIVLVAAALILCAAAAYILLSKAVVLHNLFALLVFGLGLLYLITITPLSGPDELRHYRWSYEVSDILMGKDVESREANREHFDFDGFVCHYNMSSGYLRNGEDMFTRTEEEDSLNVFREADIDYLPMHLFGGIGITISRLLGFGVVMTFLLGRLCNLLFFTVSVRFAVKRTPRFKLLLGMVALFPMTLHQAASFSYDCFINCMAFLLISSLFKAMWEKDKLPVRDYIAIMVFGVLLAPAKLVYTPIVGLALCIPAQRFGSKKKKALAVIGLFAACLGFLFALKWETVVSTLGFGQTAADAASGKVKLNWEGCVSYSMRDVYAEPLHMLYVYGNTIVQDGLNYCAMAVGVALSGLSLPISRKLIAAICAVTLLTLPNDTKIWQTKRSAALSLTIACGVTLLIMTGMLGWTSNTRDVIQGVQGRYLIPIIPLALSSFSFRMKGFTRQRRLLLVIPMLALEWAVLLEVLNYTMLH